LAAHAWYDDNAEMRSHPVGTKRPNSWGLFDMHGNIAEYCLDWYAPLPLRKAVDPRGPQEGRFRVIRSYAFFDPAVALRSDSRAGYGPAHSMVHFGLRVLCEDVGNP
jgi:formylglycine-generating enzyme required for sulfatase activity